MVHLDDLATHAEPFGWTERLRAGVLEPFARGEAGAYPVYDWTRRRFGPVRRVQAAPVVLLEGGCGPPGGAPGAGPPGVDGT
ncbi:hypothetical protein GCM10025734_70600 [Kitasatospora paranensis]